MIAVAELNDLTIAELSAEITELRVLRDSMIGSYVEDIISDRLVILYRIRYEKEQMRL